jgi:hypothetical protein
MNKKPNAAKAGQSTSTNELIPGAVNARGHRKSGTKRFDFSELNAVSQGKRLSIAIAADLQEHPPEALRRLTKNLDALKAIYLAESIKARYLVFGGRLMHEDAGCIAVTILDHAMAAEQLTTAVEAVNARLMEMSDCTMWCPLLNSKDRMRIAPRLVVGGTA